MYKAKSNFCRTYRVNCFEEQAENQYVAKLNIRGVLLVVRNRLSKRQQLNPTLVKIVRSILSD